MCMKPTRVAGGAVSAAVAKTWLHTNVPAVVDSEVGMPDAAASRTIALAGSDVNSAAGPPATDGSSIGCAPSTIS